MTSMYVIVLEYPEISIGKYRSVRKIRDYEVSVRGFESQCNTAESAQQVKA